MFQGPDDNPPERRHVKRFSADPNERGAHWPAGHDADQSDRPRSDQIREQIDQTRREMDRTVDQLQQRLDPEHYTRGAVHALAQSATPVVRYVRRLIVENRVPAALIGFGLAWLIVTQLKVPRESAPSNVGRQRETAFFTIGLIGGLAIPSTRREDRLLGLVRDRIVRKARETGAELIERGEEAAERAIDAAERAVSEAAEAVGAQVKFSGP
jgi:hypothetical protein